jgi:hypothetical protein
VLSASDFSEAVETVGKALDAFGVAVIVVGIAVATFAYLRRRVPPGSSTTHQPQAAPVGTGDRAVLEWLNASHRRQVRRMATWSDTSWRTTVASVDPAHLVSRYRAHRLLGWLEVPLERAGAAS